MNIISKQNKWVLVGILAIIGGGAAFVFFDPLGLDLLGGKGRAAVVKPVAQPHVAAPAAKPGVAVPAAKPPAAAPKAAVAPAATPAPSIQPPLTVC